MYFITDIAPIVAAMDAKTPRPIHEIMEERYPDATMDHNGRYHAPCDGYMCPLTGNLYRGGEYLPFDQEETSYACRRSDWPFVAMSAKGEIYSVDGMTKAQKAAGAGAAKEQQAAFDRQTQHVGTVKGRETLTLTLVATFAHSAYYGLEQTSYFRDTEGNSVVWKGSKYLMHPKVFGRETQVQVGETVTVKTTIKSHWTSADGRKATYVTRTQTVK